MNEIIKKLIKHLPTALVVASVLISSFMGYRFYILSSLVIENDAKMRNLEARFPELVITVVNESLKLQQTEKK